MAAAAAEVNDPPTRDELEASCRRLMARHAAIEPRGYDTDRQRLRLRDEIDAVLDRIKALDEA